MLNLSSFFLTVSSTLSAVHVSGPVSLWWQQTVTSSLSRTFWEELSVFTWMCCLLLHEVQCAICLYSFKQWESGKRISLYALLLADLPPTPSGHVFPPVGHVLKSLTITQIQLRYADADWHCRGCGKAVFLLSFFCSSSW